MPLNGESKDDVVAVSGRDLLDEVERARIGRATDEVRGSVRSSVREVCARDAMAGEGVVLSIGVPRMMGEL